MREPSVRYKPFSSLQSNFVTGGFLLSACYIDAMSQLDRRDFLRATGVTALGSALNQGVHGANDRIAIGFIGIGVMGTENLRAAMDQPGVAVSAVCDVYQPHLERAAALARKSGHQPKETADFREIISDPSIDAVCISTPDHWHPYMTVEACKA